MVGQLRGKATDEQFHIMIRSRIVRNMSNGDYNSIINAVCMIFDCDPGEVYILEKDTPCVVELIGVPYAALSSAGLGLENAVKIIKELLPAGIRLETFILNGTFEFADTADEYDENAGFGDIEQTIGGYLGMVAVGEDVDLPI